MTLFPEWKQVTLNILKALLKAHRRQRDLVTNYSKTLERLYEKEIKSLTVERKVII